MSKSLPQPRKAGNRGLAGLWGERMRQSLTTMDPPPVVSCHRWFLTQGLIRTWVLLVTECLHQNPQHNPMRVAGFGSKAIRWNKMGLGNPGSTELLRCWVGYELKVQILCLVGSLNGASYSKSPKILSSPQIFQRVTGNSFQLNQNKSRPRYFPESIKS